MSACDGDIDFQSTYMVDFKKHERTKSPRRKAVDDDCLIVGFGRDHLKSLDEPQKKQDILCPLEREYYLNEIKRLDPDCPKVKKVHFENEVIDPVPILNDIQDSKRTEYLVKYCSRELPFMSVNLARRARALQTLRLPDDVHIAQTVQRLSYRKPPREKMIPPATLSMRPKYDPRLKEELRKITKIKTGESTYSGEIGLIGKIILDKNPYGVARKEPKYGRWKTPNVYTYML